MDSEQNKETKPEEAAAPSTVENEEKKKGKKIKTRKKKISQVAARGNAYILATYNNTIVTITDQNGNVIAWSSAGKVGFKGAKKATAYAAGVVVKDIASKVVPRGLREVDVFVKGVGTGREGAIRAFNANRIDTISIKDITPIPHNGCRPRKVRRV